MSRYFSKPKALWVEDEDAWDRRVEIGTPTAWDFESADTGLLDAEGNTIWRGPNPIGFVWEGE